jgi:hypothetical protein
MMRAVRWHRPLLALAAVMVVLAAVCSVGLVVDPRLITGAPLWAKPLKFAVSIAVYALTLAWLIGLLVRWRPVAWWAGTVSAVFLAVEAVVIVGAAATGTTSHFNVSTPLATAVWAVMAVSISIVWIAALPVALLLLRTRLGDPARTLAIRAGLVIALIGMAIAFLMTSPTAGQLADFRGIAGAHTIGSADGGAGLPLLGWSTVAGDLRVPHFVGMHALQLLPLAALSLELLSARLPALRRPGTRWGIILVVTVLYAAVLAALTAQALRGESVVRPGSGMIAASVSLFAAAAVAIVVVLRRPAGEPA